MSETANQKPEIKANEDISNIGYQFSPELHDSLYSYLNTRPMDEVEGFMQQIFESKTPKDKLFLSTEGLEKVITYLKKSCPRKEAKPFIDMMLNGHIQKFRLEIPKEEAGEVNPSQSN